MTTDNGTYAHTHTRTHTHTHKHHNKMYCQYIVTLTYQHDLYLTRGDVSDTQLIHECKHRRKHNDLNNTVYDNKNLCFSDGSLLVLIFGPHFKPVLFSICSLF